MIRIKSLPFSLVLLLNALGVIFCAFLIVRSLGPGVGEWLAANTAGGYILLRPVNGSILGLSASSLCLGFYTFQLMLFLKFREFSPEQGLLRTYLGLFASSAALAVSLYLIYTIESHSDRVCFACHALNAINGMLFIIHIGRFIQVHLPAALFGVKMRLLGTDSAGSILVAFLIALNVTFTVNLIETKRLLASEIEIFEQNIALVMVHDDHDAHQLMISMGVTPEFRSGGVILSRPTDIPHDLNWL